MYRLVRWFYRYRIWVTLCSLLGLSFSSPLFYWLWLDAQRSCALHAVTFAIGVLCR